MCCVSRVGLLGICAAALAGACARRDATVNGSVSRSGEVSREQLLSELKQLDVTRREKAADLLRTEHHHLLDALMKILDEADAAGSFARKATAANLLGDFHALEAVPTLCNHIDLEVPVFVSEPQEFYFEGHPCADAIRAMGPSALKPTLEALGTRGAALSQEDCRVAAHLIVSLCDNSKADAIKAIRKAEEQFPESKNLHPIRMQIEHFMDFHKNVERQRAEPSA